VGVQRRLVLLRELAIGLHLRRFLDLLLAVGRDDVVPVVLGVLERHERGLATEHAGVDQRPLRPVGLSIEVDLLDLAELVAVGVDRGAAAPLDDFGCVRHAVASCSGPAPGALLDRSPWTGGSRTRRTGAALWGCSAARREREAPCVPSITRRRPDAGRRDGHRRSYRGSGPVRLAGGAHGGPERLVELDAVDDGALQRAANSRRSAGEGQACLVAVRATQRVAEQTNGLLALDADRAQVDRCEPSPEPQRDRESPLQGEGRLGSISPSTATSGISFTDGVQ
jgi:hypothetical protein